MDDLPDRLGSAWRRSTATSSGSVSNRNYDAFGLTLSTMGSPVGPFGYAATSGYQEDADSGLKLLGHRYYDASTGRFLSRDPAQDGRNWYAYCDGNPLTSVDETGLKPGDRYHSRDAAGKQAIRDINDTSIREGREYAGRVYQNEDGTWSYTEPRAGGPDHSDHGPYPPGRGGPGQGGRYHTHGADTPGYDNEDFSTGFDGHDGDIENANHEFEPSYLGTPGGVIKRYDPPSRHYRKGRKGKVTPIGRT